MDWFNIFLIAGSTYFALGILDKLVDGWLAARFWYITKQHDKYCEDCADELMAETFKSMREGEDD